jgi:HTH-type transcriptional regulator, transcriptional repressor of NAD biosynthesis genes
METKRKIGMYGGKFLPLHLGHVNAMVMASTIVDELHVVVSHDEEYEKQVFSGTGMKPISAVQRLRWWSEITADLDHVFVHSVCEKQTDEFEDWLEGAKAIKAAVGKEIDTVFSSENSYNKYFNELYPNAEHIVLDNDRELFNISAEQIREEGPYIHWDMIPKEVRPYFVKKVVVVGTESSGKSTLVRNLARVYNTSYVEEYGRTYYERFKDSMSITLESDYHEIAFENKYHERMQTRTANKVIFIDTEAIVTQYYSELYVGKKLDILSEVAKLQDYDLHIYLEPDVEWVNDGMRAHGDQAIRDENNRSMKRMFDEAGVDYVTVSGNYETRFEKCKALVKGIL